MLPDLSQRRPAGSLEWCAAGRDAQARARGSESSLQWMALETLLLSFMWLSASRTCMQHMQHVQHCWSWAELAACDGSFPIRDFRLEGRDTDARLHLDHCMPKVAPLAKASGNERHVLRPRPKKAQAQSMELTKQRRRLVLQGNLPIPARQNGHIFCMSTQCVSRTRVGLTAGMRY